MSAYKPFFFFLFVIIFFIVLYKVSHSPENDADKYYKIYFSKIITVKVLPIDRYERSYTVDYTHYNTGFSLIGYKALSGSIYVFNFQDSISKKYFSLRLFDKDYQITHFIHESLVENENNVYVNKDDLNNPASGTKQNPIPIFSFKGVKEPVRVESDNPGSVNGYKTLEPTQAEYEHNVLLYLKYIMTKEEFKKRFQGGK
jgi:hypothetical protein